MNSFLCFSVFIVALFGLKAEADLIEEGCKFIRANDDLVEDMVKCETDNYPPRFNELSRTCLQEAIGMTKAEHIRAKCQNRDHLTQAMLKVQSCVMRHLDVILRMTSEIMSGYQKAQSCIQNIVAERLHSNSPTIRSSSATEFSGRGRRAIDLAKETASAILEVRGIN